MDGSLKSGGDSVGTAALRDTALELAKKLTSTQSMIVLAFIVAGLVIIQLAAQPNAGPALWIVAGLFVLVAAAAIILRWLDFPKARGLTDEDKQAVEAALVDARDKVAARLKCDPRRCRANVFGKNALGRLQIVEPLKVNMDRVAEWAISMPPGRGGTGIAWATGQPKVLMAPFEGDEDLDPADAARVDDRLKWIISVPVSVGGAVKWVLNVDGMDERPREQVEQAVTDVESCVPLLRPSALKA